MPYIRVCGRGIRIPDLDQLFAYETPKLVRVIDFKPGLVYRVGIVFIFFYILSVGIAAKQYLETSDSHGITTITLAKTADNLLLKSTLAGGGSGNNWDRYDLIFPPTEVGGLFITTKSESTNGQTMKQCPNTNTKFPACKKKLPIYPGLKYPGTSYCMEYTWCPIMGQGGSSSAETLDSKGIADLDLEFTSYLNWFPKAATPKFMSTTKIIKVKALLAMAGVKDVKAIMETGAVVYVKFSYGTAAMPCATAGECVPGMRAIRLDVSKGMMRPGFKMRRSNYYRGNGTAISAKREMRDVSRVFGLRIVSGTSGHGETFSLYACLLQIACALAMAKMVYFVADIFTIYLNLKAFKYYAFKYEATPDFGDLKEAAEAAKVDKLANKKTKRPRRNRARVKASGEESEEEE